MPMSRREFVAASLTTAAAAVAARGQAARPDVLLIYSDDQRFSTIRALGTPEVETPNLDRLVARGTAFTHACIQGGSSGAVCVASRAMLMTGRWLHRVSDNLNQGEALWPKALQRAGYDTFATGKWHNGAASFERCWGAGRAVFLGGMGDQQKVSVADLDPATGKLGAKRVEQRWTSELFADQTIARLSAPAASQPGAGQRLTYCALTAPHDPRTCPAEFRARYDETKLPLPANFLPQHPFDNGELRVRDELLAAIPRQPDEIRRHLADYYACITYLDYQVGRILDALTASGRAENTIVVFAGDNGLALGQHGLMGKQSLYDHSVRVPLIMAGPGIKAGARCDSLVLINDLCPTICELTGTPVPEGVDGSSLAPCLRDAGAKVRDSVFLGYRRLMRAVRTERDKLIVTNVKGQRTVQLFDLAEDPGETRNLAGARPERVAALTDLLRDWMRRCGDPVELDQANWQGPQGAGQ